METDILFIQPSFLRGASRTLDLWGTLDEYNSSVSGVEADELAMKADLMAMSEDSKKAFAVFESEMGKKTASAE